MILTGFGETINKTPTMLVHSRPEIKGCLLFKLLQAYGDASDSWYNNEKKEIKEAVFNVILRGIPKSQRDWQETLEHIGEFNQQGQLTATVKPGASAAEKMKRAGNNYQLLLKELSFDYDDWKILINHLKTLR